MSIIRKSGRKQFGIFDSVKVSKGQGNKIWKVRMGPNAIWFGCLLGVSEFEGRKLSYVDMVVKIFPLIGLVMRNLGEVKSRNRKCEVYLKLVAEICMGMK